MIPGSEVLTVYSMDWRVFESFIESVYSKPYDFIASMDSHNDVHHLFHVVKDVEDKYYQEDVELFITTEVERGKYFATGGTCSPYSLFQDMVNRELIPEGEYLISVSW